VTIPQATLAIAREREQRTLEPLLLTRLTPTAILCGWLASRGEIGDEEECGPRMNKRQERDPAGRAAQAARQRATSAYG
jgi:hypothetical protein